MQYPHAKLLIPPVEIYLLSSNGLRLISFLLNVYISYEHLERSLFAFPSLFLVVVDVPNNLDALFAVEQTV